MVVLHNKAVKAPCEPVLLEPGSKSQKFSSKAGGPYYMPSNNEPMKHLITMLICLAALLSPLTYAAELFAEMPNDIKPDERYVIYSHGLIVEGEDPMPVSPEFGVYDFPAVKNALFADGDFNLIAQQRPKNTEFLPYVATLESWVIRLLEAGVPPSRITLVGFSRGSHLTAYASDRLKDRGINTALLASCIDGDIAKNGSPLMLGGHVLNIYETSDVAGSCEKLASRSELLSVKEIAITTGRRHGAFFQPLPEWVEPLKVWIRETNR
jgi:hypothetical protein